MGSTCHLTTDLDAPAQSRRVVEAWMAGHPRRDYVVLAVSEIVANAVKHGGTSAVSSGLTLWYGASADHIRISVTHQGKGFNPATDNEIHGLALVDRVVDRWGIETGEGTVTVWVEIREMSDQQSGKADRDAPDHR